MVLSKKGVAKRKTELIICFLFALGIGRDLSRKMVHRTNIEIAKVPSLR